MFHSCVSSFWLVPSNSAKRCSNSPVSSARAIAARTVAAAWPSSTESSPAAISLSTFTPASLIDLGLPSITPKSSALRAPRGVRLYSFGRLFAKPPFLSLHVTVSELAHLDDLPTGRCDLFGVFAAERGFYQRFLDAVVYAVLGRAQRFGELRMNAFPRMQRPNVNAKLNGNFRIDQAVGCRGRRPSSLCAGRTSPARPAVAFLRQSIWIPWLAWPGWRQAGG